MISHITYHASRARIDDFLRQAAEQRIAKEARLRLDASPPRCSASRSAGRRGCDGSCAASILERRHAERAS
jgi:hypothetical protein